MSPPAQAERHYSPWLIDELVPCETLVVDDVVVWLVNAVRQPVVAHELPHILYHIVFCAPGRQRYEGDIGRYDQLGRAVPSGLIEHQHRMRTWRDVKGYFLKMHAHRLAVAFGHDDAGGLSFGVTDVLP